MNDSDLSPQRAARLRRAQTLARKINLLLDTIRTESGQPFDYPAIRDAAQKEAGYYISRTRWSLLKSGKEQVVPDKALVAIARVFDVDPQYLLQDIGDMPQQVEVKLEQVRAKRRAEVRNFATRVLGPVDPEALCAIAKILDEDTWPRPLAGAVTTAARRKPVTNRRTYDPTNKEQVFATLRREILAARLKVTLDEQLNRETSPTVKPLGKMKLPAKSAHKAFLAWHVPGPLYQA